MRRSRRKPIIDLQLQMLFGVASYNPWVCLFRLTTGRTVGGPFASLAPPMPGASPDWSPIRAGGADAGDAAALWRACGCAAFRL